MAQSLLRGSSQILDASIPLTKLVSGYSIPTANLAQGANFVQKDGSVAFAANQSMGNFKITNIADATVGTDVPSYTQVQALVNGVAVRRARVVATANVATLSGSPTTDAVTLVDGDIELLTAQTTASQNGPWVVHAGAWTRPSNWAAASSQKSTIFFVEEGTTNHDTKWITITDAITVDTTSVTITQDTSGTSYSGTGVINLSGTVFSLNLGQGVENDGSNNLRVKLSGASLLRGASGLAINPGSAGQIPITNAGATDVTMVSFSGDVTVTAAGVATVNAATFVKATNYVTAEVPGGSVNGSNTAFTLANTPVAGSERLFLNGQRLKPGSGNDYTISGLNITALFAPIIGDQLLADYLK